MPLEDTKTIDMISKNESGGIDLIITDSGALSNPEERIDKLRRKLQSYANYAASEDFSLDYPGFSVNDVRIIVICRREHRELMRRIDQIVPEKYPHMAIPVKFRLWNSRKERKKYLNTMQSKKKRRNVRSGEKIKLSPDSLQSLDEAKKFKLRPKIVKKMKLLMLLGFIAGPAILLFGLFHCYQIHMLQTRGQTVIGEIYDSSIINTGGDRVVYRLIVDYAPEKSEKLRKEFSVQKNAYDRAMGSGKISVRYLPGNPEIAKIEEHIEANAGPVFVGISVILISFMIRTYIRRKMKKI